MKVQSWSGTSQSNDGSNLDMNLLDPTQAQMVVRNLSVPRRFNDGQEPLDSTKVPIWSGTSRSMKEQNVCQEPSDSMKEQMLVRNLSIS